MDKKIMGIVNCIMVEIFTHAGITFFTQNKPMNNHLKCGRCSVGHFAYVIFIIF
jgi:hypothetical protein